MKTLDFCIVPKVYLQREFGMTKSAFMLINENNGSLGPRDLN